MCDGNGSSVHLQLKPLAASSGSDDPRNLVELPTISSRRFSSSTKSPLLRHLFPMRPLLNQNSKEPKGLSLLSFVFKCLQRSFVRSAHPSTFNHSPSVEVLLGSVRFTRSTGSQRSPSQSATEARPRPALTCTARILNPTLGKEKTRSNYLAASTHFMRRYSTALDAGISRLQQRNN
jgi:hypothetical protein